MNKVKNKQDIIDKKLKNVTTLTVSGGVVGLIAAIIYYVNINKIIDSILVFFFFLGIGFIIGSYSLFIYLLNEKKKK